MVGATSPVSPWLQVLLREKFFIPCHLHDSVKKNEKSVFCMDFCASICPYCLPHHGSHSLLQIRRYVHRDVIRLDDAQKLLNCSHVQPYTTNSAKVVFLKQKPFSRSFRGSKNFCATCNRSLQDRYSFCSLSCKVYNQTVNNFGSRRQVYNHNCNFKFFPLCSDSKHPKKYSNSKNKNCNDHVDGHLTTNCTVDSPNLELAFSGSSTATTISYDKSRTAIRNALSNTAGNEFVKKNRAARSVNGEASMFKHLPDSNITSLMNRRKGIPRRSHLY